MNLGTTANIVLLVIGIATLIGAFVLLFFGIRHVKKRRQATKDYDFLIGKTTPFWNYLINLLYFGGFLILICVGLVLVSVFGALV